MICRLYIRKPAAQVAQHNGRRHRQAMRLAFGRSPDISWPSTI
jgi:hypothetical protein